MLDSYRTARARTAGAVRPVPAGRLRAQGRRRGQRRNPRRHALLGDDANDPLFLQAKEAGRAVLEEFVGGSEYANCLQRSASASCSDISLGWVRVRGFDGHTGLLPRQLRDWKGSAEIETMVPHGMPYGELCGWTLARAHARSGDRIATISAQAPRSPGPTPTRTSVTTRR
jgi:Uncharacterized protein conserved in bacteria (DUF2252)